MKKSMILVMAAAAAALTLVSCTKELNGNNEENNQTSGLRTLTVSFAPNTRTYLDTDGLKPLWIGDGTEKISLNGTDYTVPAEAAGKDSFTLTTTIEGDITAVYPASAWNNSAPYFIVEASQDGSFANANICVASAKAGDTELSFKNQTAIIKVNVPTDTYNLTLTSLNPVDDSGQRGDDGAVAIADDLATEITISNDSGIPNPCYVSILPCTVLLQDLNVDVEYSEDKKAQGGFSPNAIKARGENPSEYAVKVNTIYTLAETSLHEYVEVEMTVNEDEKTYKWATMNVGASSPTEYGDYFAWGETTGHVGNTSTKKFENDYSFSWTNAPFNGGNSNFNFDLIKELFDTVCPNGVLALAYDAANVNWGGSWRMPTKAEFDALAALDNGWQTDYNGTGVNGREFGNENTVFFPAAGDGNDTRLSSSASGGSYWSSLITNFPDSACGLYFYDGDVGTDNFNRYLGFSVRPLSALSE